MLYLHKHEETLHGSLNSGFQFKNISYFIKERKCFDQSTPLIIYWTYWKPQKGLPLYTLEQGLEG